jgi:beta-phosphoglucomutase-like phosphatase (HAD superfamily)
MGLRAALAAGLPTVVTQNPYTASDDTTGALAVLDDLSTMTLADLSALHHTLHPGTQVRPAPTH